MRLLIISLLFVNHSLFATEQLAYREADSLSYQLYVQGRADDLNKLTEIALHEGIDFYYLRMRTAILQYNHKNYEKALPHFKRANEMFPADTISLEYLYYSFLYTGRSEDARIIAKKMPERLQKKVGYQDRFFTYAGISTTLLFNTNIKENSNLDFRRRSASVAEVYLQGNSNSQSVFLANTIRNRILLNQSFSLFNNQSASVINTTPYKMAEFTDHSYQYNAGLSYRSSKDWFGGVSVGIYRSRFTWLTSWLAYNDTVTRFYEYLNDFKSTSFSFYGGKRMKNIELNTGITFSNFAEGKQLQGGLNLTYYPFGNNNFYVHSGVYLNQNDSTFQQVYQLSTGFKINKYMAVDLTGSMGNHANFISLNGIMAMNTVDKITHSAGLTLKLFTGHIQTDVNFTFQNRETEYLNWITYSKSEKITFSYPNKLLTLTLRWNQ